MRFSCALAIAFTLFLGACNRTSEAEVREYLAEQGITATSVTKNGDSFEYTGTKGTETCTGTVRINKGFGGSTQSFSSNCGKGAAPADEPDYSACKPGAAAECNKLADALYGKDEKVYPKRAAKLYRVACDDKDGRACERVAEFEAIDKSWDEVRFFAERACNYGNGDGCARLGTLELTQTEAAGSAGRALDFFKDGCEKGSKKGCRGTVALMLNATPPDLDHALPLAEKLCTEKYDDGCTLLGMALFAKKDYPRALTLLEEGCKVEKYATRAIACNLAGAILADGRGTKADATRAFQLFESACEQGNPDGCANTARAYEGARGVAKDLDKARELREKACKLGHQKSCAK